MRRGYNYYYYAFNNAWGEPRVIVSAGFPARMPRRREGFNGSRYSRLAFRISIPPQGYLDGGRAHTRGNSRVTRESRVVPSGILHASMPTWGVHLRAPAYACSRSYNLATVKRRVDKTTACWLRRDKRGHSMSIPGASCRARFKYS